MLHTKELLDNDSSDPALLAQNTDSACLACSIPKTSQQTEMCQVLALGQCCLSHMYARLAAQGCRVLTCMFHMSALASTLVKPRCNTVEYSMQGVMSLHASYMSVTASTISIHCLCAYFHPRYTVFAQHSKRF